MPSLAASTTSPSPETPALFSPRPRCQHISRNGRPCRYLAVSAKQPFCKHHLPPGSPERLSETMYRISHDFNTPEGVTNVLHYIFFALADGDISERRAGVLTYILQTILNSQRTDLQLQKLVATAERQGLVVDNPYVTDTASDPDASQDPCPDKLTGNLPPFDTAATQESGVPGNTDLPMGAPRSGASSACPDNGRDPCLSSPDVPPTNCSASPISQTSGVPTGQANSLAEKLTPKSPAPPPPDLNHFFPRDPSLSRHLQDPSACSPPLPSRLFNSRFRSVKVSRPNPHDDDWKIINGR